MIGKARAIWRILNGKLDRLLHASEAVQSDPRLDRAIGEAVAARQEAFALRQRLAALEQQLQHSRAESAERQDALGQRFDALARGQQALCERADLLLAESAAARREHVSLAEGLTAQHEATSEALHRIEALGARFNALHDHLYLLHDRTLEPMRRGLGRIEGRQLADAPLKESEFQVFSQAGEDGILWRLSRLVPAEKRRFVEFGVEDYREANSRFLLTDGGWSGLVLDGDPENVERIRTSALYWQHALKAEAAFITRENINALLRQSGVSGEIGYLSIDIDGNDWWVWDAIDAVDPLLVSVEFNWRFGPHRSVSIPYDPGFIRQRAHPSWLYFGASLTALERLGARKGYALVAIGTSAVNAFFVRRDILPPDLPARSASELWRPGRFSEGHDEHGAMVKLSEEAQQELVLSLPLVEID